MLKCFADLCTLATAPALAWGWISWCVDGCTPLIHSLTWGPEAAGYTFHTQYSEIAPNQELKADRRWGSGRTVCSEEGADRGSLVFCIIQQAEEKGAWGWALQLIREPIHLLGQTAIVFDGAGVRATFLQRKAEVCSITPLGRWTSELEAELHKIEQM